MWLGGWMKQILNPVFLFPVWWRHYDLTSFVTVCRGGDHLSQNVDGRCTKTQERWDIQSIFLDNAFRTYYLNTAAILIGLIFWVSHIDKTLIDSYCAILFIWQENTNRFVLHSPQFQVNEKKRIFILKNLLHLISSLSIQFF